MRAKQSITIADEARKRAVASLKRYLDEEFDEEVGDLKAGLFVDFLLEELGPTIYNRAILDARAFFEERTADLEGICYHAEFPYWAKQ